MSFVSVCKRTWLKMTIMASAAMPKSVDSSNATPSRNIQPRHRATRLRLGNTLPNGIGKKMTNPITAIHNAHSGRALSSVNGCQRGLSQRLAWV